MSKKQEPFSFTSFKDLVWPSRKKENEELPSKTSLLEKFAS